MKNKNKKMVEMECPICGEYYFVDDSDLVKSDPDYEPLLDHCCHCGWIYDYDQFENPDLKEGENEMSLNEYKEWFKSKLAEDPNYDYSEANYVITPHMCPVCGKYEFPDNNSFDICPFCGWEDDGLQQDNPDYGGGANDLSLNQHREKYEAIISKDPKYMWFKP